MGISINWKTKVIFVPREYTKLLKTVPYELRQLNIDQFRRDLSELTSSKEGIPHDDTHFHMTEVQLGTEVYARVIGIYNGYTVTFENASYAVVLHGANSNISDVLNLNQVQIRSANSKGLIVYSKNCPDPSDDSLTETDTPTGSYTKCDIEAIAKAVWAKHEELGGAIHTADDSRNAKIAKEMAYNKVVLSDCNKLITVYSDDGKEAIHKFQISKDKKIKQPRKL